MVCLVVVLLCISFSPTYHTIVAIGLLTEGVHVRDSNVLLATAEVVLLFNVRFSFVRVTLLTCTAS